MPDDPVSLEEQSDDNEALVDKDDRIQDKVLRLGDFLDTLTISLSFEQIYIYTCVLAKKSKAESQQLKIPQVRCRQ